MLTVNKKHSVFALACCLLLLSSCQKEPTEELTPGTSSNRVKTYSEAVTTPAGNLSSEFNLSYDNNGRVTGITSASSPGDKFVYAYPSNTLYTMDIYNRGLLSIHEDFFLNSSSLVDSTMQYNDTKDTTTEGYTYNANKQLTRLKEYDYKKSTGSVLYNTTTFTYGADGNLVKSQDSDGEVHTYEFYSNYSYAPPVTIGPITNATTKKINLLKTHSVSSNGISLGSAVFTYTFDDKDRISTEKAVLDDGSTVLKTYTYF